ncbi:hypothetical protein L3Q82_017129 [Scortum barcoo]|uniref:Uncharacterized protein n=1 Tax=Scortum barcoo TaxID=214431 RepID=A0ACB8XAG6_9TELE|nr:hypothetical protein L3Q82_017129 [Scortum barcoo]
MANERLRALEEVEKEIAMTLQCAGLRKITNCAEQVTVPGPLTPKGSKRPTFTAELTCCMLPSAGNIVLELSKDKHNASLLDRQLVQFQSSVSRVENELSAQIRYLTQVATGQPHEGSTYSARKDCQMALNRAEYAKVKLGELGRTCEVMLEQQQQQQT